MDVKPIDQALSIISNVQDHAFADETVRKVIADLNLEENVDRAQVHASLKGRVGHVFPKSPTWFSRVKDILMGVSHENTELLIASKLDLCNKRGVIDAGLVTVSVDFIQ